MHDELISLSITGWGEAEDCWGSDEDWTRETKDEEKRREKVEKRTDDSFRYNLCSILLNTHLST